MYLTSQKYSDAKKFVKKILIVTGSILAVLRVSSLWIGSSFLTNTADSRQVVGYVLCLFSLPEALVVSGLRNNVAAWKWSLSLLLILGSYLWAYIALSMLKGRKFVIK